VSDDIVKRLRQIPSAWPMVREAADEIERLRVQALGTQRRIQDQDGIMAELWERIHALTDERDEARRELCRRNRQPCPQDDEVIQLALRIYAEERGWDCYKEDGK
jgi:hypothetical protein